MKFFEIFEYWTLKIKVIITQNNLDRNTSKIMDDIEKI